MQPETVLEQLKRIIREYDVRGFLFTDDHFFIDMKRAYGILEGIVRLNLNITISKLQLRADTICRMDRDFLDLIARAGVKRMTVGVESGNQRVLDLIKKDVYIDEVIEANRKLAPYPIIPLYLFMMGMPAAIQWDPEVLHAFFHQDGYQNTQSSHRSRDELLVNE